MYFVYILTNRFRSVLYTGVTNDLRRRMDEHRLGLVQGFTEKYRCKYLLHAESFKDVRDALIREKQLKGWSRKKKEDLIRTANPALDDISVEMLL